MDCPIRAESGKGRSAHIFNLNERAVSNPCNKVHNKVLITRTSLVMTLVTDTNINTYESVS